MTAAMRHQPAALRRAKSSPFARPEQEAASPSRLYRQQSLDSCCSEADSPSKYELDMNAFMNADANEADADTRLTKATWAEAEDYELLAAVKRWGTVWPSVAAQLPGRTADAVRNRWHRLRHQQRALASAAASGADLPLGESSDPDSSVRLRDAACLDAAAEGDVARPAASLVPAVSDSPPRVPDDAESRFSGPGASDKPLSEYDSLLIEGKLGAAAAAHARAIWSPHEDELIIEGVRRHGCKWRQIAAMLPNRSDSSIRNRWVRLQTTARRRPIGEASSDELQSSHPHPAAGGSGAAADSGAMGRSAIGGSGAPSNMEDDSTAAILVSFASQFAAQTDG